MKKTILIGAMTIIVALLWACETTSSDDDGDTGEAIDLTGKIVIPAGTRDTVLFVSSFGDVEIPIRISIPSTTSNALAGMVVLHGSGGPWQDSDTDDDGIDDTIEMWELSNQNEDWKEIFDNENMISAFPGSYYVRGTVENEGEWKNPPIQFQISASFVRNRDAYATLDVLRKLVRSDGTPIVQSENIGLLGFSHGGTATQSTIFDTSAIPGGWEWTQSYSGTQYSNEVAPPVSLPEDGGFKVAVMYYPGSFHNSYYGNPCTGNSIFRTYTDFMLHLASEDPLTANSNCMVETVQNNGGGVATVHTYDNANHSFDGRTTGIDGSASTLARQRSIAYIKDRLEVD